MSGHFENFFVMDISTNKVKNKQKIFSAIRQFMSKKRRYKEDEYNLDLSYVTNKVIAMGFPSENIEFIYRNSLDELCQFLEDKHKGHYKIYNLYSERSYNIQK